MSSSRPHIVLIMTDQQKASATSIMGNPYVATPTWERLARQGVTFENTYSQSAICTPSRASMMTGTYPLVHRVLCHQNHAPPNLPQLAELLSAGGYRTIGAGHYEKTRSLDRGWHDEVDIKGNVRLKKALAKQYDCGSREVGWSAGETSAGPEEAHAAVLNDELFQMLDEVDPAEAPLFLHVAYIEPHPPYFTPIGYCDQDVARAAPLPDVGDLPNRPLWHQQMLRDYGSARATDADKRRMLAAYYGLIKYVDQQINRLLRYLDRRGILENAWVVLTSDHGDFAGEKGFYTKSECAYECILHVPMVIRGPGGAWHAGSRQKNLVELLDLFPTILNLAQVPIPKQNQGQDLISWIDRGASKPLRHATFSAVGAYGGYLKTTMPHGLPECGRRKGIVRGARSLTHSYIRDPDTGDEAYDLTTDPLELRNLLQQPAAIPESIKQLSREMDEWEAGCQRLQDELRIEPGNRNFDEPVPLTGSAAPLRSV